MGPLQAILDALQDNMDNFLSEDYGFQVNPETGDVIVETYNEEGDEILSRTLVRLSTVQCVRLSTQGQADNG